MGQFVGLARRLVVVGVIATSLAACESITPAASEETIPQVQARLLATVYISPTPDAAQQQATRIAALPSLTAQPPTPPPSPTVYVGVFLEPADSDPDVPILDPTQVFALVPGLPTERPSRCQIPPDERFGEAWRSEANAVRMMACPIEAITNFTGTVQVFERGVMYYQQGGPIWAIEATNDGFPNKHWTITQSLPPVEGDPGITPPEGLRVPVFGFGAVWFGVSGVRDTLGFARTGEQQTQLAYQRFEGGTLFLDASGETVFILLANGTAFGPF